MLWYVHWHTCPNPRYRYKAAVKTPKTAVISLSVEFHRLLLRLLWHLWPQSSPVASSPPGRRNATIWNTTRRNEKRSSKGLVAKDIKRPKTWNLRHLCSILVDGTSTVVGFANSSISLPSGVSWDSPRCVQVCAFRCWIYFFSRNHIIALGIFFGIESYSSKQRVCKVRMMRRFFLLFFLGTPFNEGTLPQSFLRYAKIQFWCGCVPWVLGWNSWQKQQSAPFRHPAALKK